MRANPDTKMKVIVAGASGFVGNELIRQSLRNPRITSVVALARRDLQPPADLESGVDLTKFHSIQIKDYDQYSDNAKQQLSGADACIWTVAITPTKSRGMSMDEVRRVCHDFAMIGIKTIFEASKPRETGKPFRFIYMSGIAAERDQTKTPDFMPAYSLLRGETETAILEFASQHPGQLEACAAKPGLIIRPGDIVKTVFGWLLKTIKGVPNIDVTDISIAMLDQAVNGFYKEPLLNDELIDIARRARK